VCSFDRETITGETTTELESRDLVDLFICGAKNTDSWCTRKGDL
jgi:hypothetical protein